MSGRGVVPIGELGAGGQEAGRIKMGRKNAKGHATTTDTWRFTSPDREAIEQVAAIYGGTAQQWDDPAANQRNQWEVQTETDEVRVWVAPGGMSQWYEWWQGGTCERRCDGETCTYERYTPDGPDYIETPCICNKEIAAGEAKVPKCSPKTRMTVVVPDITFRGGWRVESSSWAAAREMPGMEQMISSLQAGGLVEGKLVIAEGTAKQRQRSGKVVTKRFRYPRLVVDVSPAALASGDGVVKLGIDAKTAPAAELEAAQPASEDPVPEPATVDDEIVDAEIVDEDQGDGDWWPSLKDAMIDTGEESTSFHKVAPHRWERA